MCKDTYYLGRSENEEIEVFQKPKRKRNHSKHVKTNEKLNIQSYTDITRFVVVDAVGSVVARSKVDVFVVVAVLVEISKTCIFSLQCLNIPFHSLFRLASE